MNRYIGRSFLALAMMLAICCSAFAYSWPTEVRQINSPYGPRCFGSHFHAGFDMRLGDDKEIYSIADGTVTYVGTGFGYGGTIVVDHGDGVFAGYHHVTDRLVNENDSVLAGDVIATTTVDHLHFNHWSAEPANDDHTLHPSRIYDDFEHLYLGVYDNSPDNCKLYSETDGGLVEASVGRSYTEYGTPFYHFVWNYEGNVREWNYYDTDEYGGGCRYSTVDNPDYEGVSPPEVFPDGGGVVNVIFDFPCDENEWIVDLVLYTYVKTANGGYAYMDSPVGNLLQEYSIRYIDGVVGVEWSCLAGGVEGDYSFSIERAAFGGEFQRILPMVSGSCGDGYKFDDSLGVGFLRVDYIVKCLGENGDVVYEFRVGCQEPGSALTRGGLGAPYPNPCNGQVSLSYIADRDAFLRFTIFDAKGRVIRHYGAVDAPVGAISWNLKDASDRAVPSGVYFVVMESDDQVISSKQITVVK